MKCPSFKKIKAYYSNNRKCRQDNHKGIHRVTSEKALKNNSLTIILDNINGLETATNPSSPTLGEELESDAEFRARIKNSLNINSIAILSSIKSNLESVQGVTDSYCYDNYTSSQETIDGVKVPAHSILACVEGGSNTDVAKVLYEKKTVGTGYILASNNQGYNVIEQTVVDEAYGNTYTVRFMRPVQTAIDVAITVKRQDFSGANLEQSVKDAVMSWYNGEIDGVDGIKIGKSVSPFEISAAVSDVIPEIFITSVGVCTHGGTPTSTTLSFGAVHKAALEESNITVTVTQ